jgi:hypothetical protein
MVAVLGGEGREEESSFVTGGGAKGVGHPVPRVLGGCGGDSAHDVDGIGGGGHEGLIGIGVEPGAIRVVGMS